MGAARWSARVYIRARDRNEALQERRQIILHVTLVNIGVGFVYSLRYHRITDDRTPHDHSGVHMTTG